MQKLITQTKKEGREMLVGMRLRREIDNQQTINEYWAPVL
jgi:hypothetical protein